ncbi:syntaxin-1A-like isoform X4 [Festucalex cinctus]
MKDRLAQLKEASDVGGDDIEVPVDNEAFMEDFFAQIEDIRSSIDKIDQSVTEIKQLYSTILSSPTSDQKTQDDLEAVTNEIKKSANNARNKLKSIEHQLETNKDERASADLRIRKSQHPGNRLQRPQWRLHHRRLRPLGRAIGGLHLARPHLRQSSSPSGPARWKGFGHFTELALFSQSLPNALLERPTANQSGFSYSNVHEQEKLTCVLPGHRAGEGGGIATPDDDHPWPATVIC